MSRNPVRRTIDLANPATMTTRQRAEIARLVARPDRAIDTSDIPVMPEKAWKAAVRGRFYKPTKTSTTVRVDSDLLAWLRAPGRGYQTRLNAILRRAMLEQLKSH